MFGVQHRAVLGEGFHQDAWLGAAGKVQQRRRGERNPGVAADAR